MATFFPAPPRVLPLPFSFCHVPHRLRVFFLLRSIPNTEDYYSRQEPFLPLRERERERSLSMAAAMRGMSLEMAAMRGRLRRREKPVAARRMSVMAADPPPESGKVFLQPRVANLRSYGSKEKGAGALIRSPPAGDAPGEISSFFVSLSDYIESSRRSQDFETLSGRLAMLAFAGTVAVEMATGSSIFRKLDMREMAEAAGVCLAVVASAAAFATATSARTRIGRMIELGYNNFVDSFIDNLVDGLFYDSDISDWSDEP